MVGIIGYYNSSDEIWYRTAENEEEVKSAIQQEVDNINIQDTPIVGNEYKYLLTYSDAKTAVYNNGDTSLYYYIVPIPCPAWKCVE